MTLWTGAIAGVPGSGQWVRVTYRKISIMMNVAFRSFPAEIILYNVVHLYDEAIKQ